MEAYSPELSDAQKYGTLPGLLATGTGQESKPAQVTSRETVEVELGQLGYGMSTC